jgi:hypothetical protein
MEALKANLAPAETHIADEYVGQDVEIRTVTMIYTGNVRWVSSLEICLTNATWVADTKNWSEFAQTGAFTEGERYPGEVRISRGAIVDWAPITLPKLT